MKNTFLILFIVSLFSFNVYAEESTIPTSGNDCGEHCSWKIEDGVLTLTGYGDIDDFPRSCEGGCHNTAPWAASAETITKIVVENEADTQGFKTIGKGVFAALSYAREAVLPEGLNKIKEYAFIGDTYLTTVNLPSSLTSIDSYAFDDTRLNSLEIPPLITELDGCVLVIFGQERSLFPKMSQQFHHLLLPYQTAHPTCRSKNFIAPNICKTNVPKRLNSAPITA
jgi:hypothetical protein